MLHPELVPLLVQKLRESFQRAPTLGGECYRAAARHRHPRGGRPFNGHPPLGVNATRLRCSNESANSSRTFQRAPTLGGECYVSAHPGACRAPRRRGFQRAPTLGGECYAYALALLVMSPNPEEFQRAPTLGGECYASGSASGSAAAWSFNGHPPLGVNATIGLERRYAGWYASFNGHPPLGVNATIVCLVFDKEFEIMSFNGHPPLGVNATCIDPRAGTGNSGFQRAPTLGGECYLCYSAVLRGRLGLEFQRAPTLGGECYGAAPWIEVVTATFLFQRAPTLGGECYTPACLP